MDLTWEEDPGEQMSQVNIPSLTPGQTSLLPHFVTSPPLLPLSFLTGGTREIPIWGPISHQLVECGDAQISMSE